MVEKPAQRRLAAILAADVVGYSRLMEIDEASTLSALKARRKDVLEPLVAKHQGRVFKITGDGVLVEFTSAVNAVQCAVDLQEGMAAANADQPDHEHIVLRIGVNLGDVMVEGSDLYGDGINIAARLEALAEPGGILVSGTAFDHIKSKVKVGFEDLGAQVLKNIAEPVRAYRVMVARPKPASGKPSIAVLPFANISGDVEQEYFSDGITEDVITDLSKVSSLHVLSRNTVFTFKGKSADVTKVGKQLNVSHVVEGSVRKAGGRVRITAQLIDASNDSHVWAERYDRELNDIFALQDEISAAIVSALKVRLLPEERKAIQQRGTTSAEAYQMLLLARNYRHSNTVADTRLALRFAQRAAEIDPKYTDAWALVAVSQIALHEMTGLGDSGLAAAEKALALDPNLAIAYATKGRVHCGLGQYEEALAAHVRSLELDPNSSDVHFLYGRTCTELGKAEEAILHHERAAALSEAEFVSLALAIQSYKSLGRDGEAMDASRRALRRIEAAIARRPDDTSALFHGASVLAELGDKDRAVEWANRALLMAPEEIRGVYLVACTFALLGDSERAIDYLDRALAGMHPGYITWVKNDSDLDCLRTHPRYQELIARSEARLAEDAGQRKSRSPLLGAR